MCVDTNIVDTSTKGIVIVEDNMLLALVYEIQIKKLGHNILGKYPDGESAIEAIKMMNPDLVIMDIMLAGKIDGIQTMERIREFSKVPVIYITGNSDVYHSKRARKTNYIDYLIKPVPNKLLSTSIQKVFN